MRAQALWHVLALHISLSHQQCTSKPFGGPGIPLRCLCPMTCQAGRFCALQRPYQANILLAGWDKKAGPTLHWMDYLATSHKMNVAGTGYGEGLHLHTGGWAGEALQPA